jgi:hypothetical protein
MEIGKTSRQRGLRFSRVVVPLPAARRPTVPNSLVRAIRQLNIYESQAARTNPLVIKSKFRTPDIPPGKMVERFGFVLSGCEPKPVRFLIFLS